MCFCPITRSLFFQHVHSWVVTKHIVSHNSIAIASRISSVGLVTYHCESLCGHCNLALKLQILPRRWYLLPASRRSKIRAPLKRRGTRFWHAQTFAKDAIVIRNQGRLHTPKKNAFPVSTVAPGLGVGGVCFHIIISAINLLCCCCLPYNKIFKI